MLTLVLFLLLFLSSLKKVLFWTGLWQTKEYRLDRLSVHIHETNQGKKLFTSSATIGGILIIFSYIVVIMFDSFSSLFQLLVMGFLLLYISQFGKDILDRKLKRPIFTGKSILIIFLSLIVITFLFFFPLTDKYLWTMFVMGITPVIVAFWVFVFSFPSELYTDYLSQKAQKKIKSLKNLTVIAVSGSYGKSSTKEAIAQVLSQKFSVVKTPLSNNTSIAVAKTILKNVNEQTDFFVVEMGAYKIGEIAQLCTIVRPHVSVTTAVSDQHISLYGNLDNVVESERELIHALPKDGIALFNANNKNTKYVAEKTKQRKIFYETTQRATNTKGNFIVGYDITANLTGVLFSAIYKDRLIHVRTSLIGQHTVENILPALFLGIHYGLSDSQLQRGISNLRTLPHTMERHILHNGAVAIDDTFNASPESVDSAIKYLSLAIKQKFFVLTPLIELGDNARERHKEIGKRLANVDYIFVTNKNYYHEIEKGIKIEKGKALLLTGTYQEIADMLTRFTHKGDSIIFEGKEAGVVLKKLL